MHTWPAISSGSFNFRWHLLALKDIPFPADKKVES